MPKWKVSGSYFETCNCDVACPCVFRSPPTMEKCALLVAWHIEGGTYGDVKLDGLNLALAAERPRDEGWKGGHLYVDKRATEVQKDALVGIFTAKAGGVPPILARVTNELSGIRTVEIDYAAEGKRRSLRIPRVAEAEVEAITGPEGTETVLSNHPVSIPAQPVVVAISKRLTAGGAEWRSRGGWLS